MRVVGNNLKSLERSEEKALEKEDGYSEQIRELNNSLREVEDGFLAFLLAFLALRLNFLHVFLLLLVFYF